MPFSPTDLVGQRRTSACDASGNLLSTTDRKGQTTQFEYDPLNRRVKSTFADGSSATFIYDAAGRLVQADDTADPHRSSTLAYDTLDRLASETTALGTVAYEYDPLGRRTQMAVSGQSPVSYAYDAASRLRTITQAPLNPVDIQYDAVGRRTKLTLPNGVSTEYQYDAASHLTSLIYRNTAGLLGDLTYTYDPVGNRTGVGGSFARTLLPDPIASATYDAANRQLTFGDKAMTYDANGNLTSITDPTGVTTFTWDARDQLVALSGPGVSASFSYDALGRRASKTINGQLTAFTYDGLDAAAESVAGVQRGYLRTLTIDEPLVRGETEFYLRDAQGSTVALTGPEGLLSTEYIYEPFGRSQVTGNASSSTVTFTGRESDGVGLVYFRARYFHPTLDRFTQEDPLGLLAGSVNFYGYPRLNPLSVVDPLGLAEFLGRGIASYYHPSLAGRPTASGQPYDPSAMTGASRDLPLGTKVEVRSDGKSVEVVINDRGPFHVDQEGNYDRIVDLSQGAFTKLVGSTAPGLVEVELFKTGFQKILRPPRGSIKARTPRGQAPREKSPAQNPFAPSGGFGQ